MAEYIDRDTAIRTAIEMCVKVVGHGITQIDAVEIANAFEDISAADVVPKSEVDLYKRLNDELEDELAQTHDKLEKAKAEVAREIFSEIEKYMTVFGDANLSTYFRGIGWKVFAELKKKYTGGGAE